MWQSGMAKAGRRWEVVLFCRSTRWLSRPGSYLQGARICSALRRRGTRLSRIGRAWHGNPWGPDWARCSWTYSAWVLGQVVSMWGAVFQRRAAFRPQMPPYGIRGCRARRSDQPCFKKVLRSFRYIRIRYAPTLVASRRSSGRRLLPHDGRRHTYHGCNPDPMIDLIPFKSKLVASNSFSVRNKMTHLGMSK